MVSPFVKVIQCHDYIIGRMYFQYALFHVFIFFVGVSPLFSCCAVV